VSSPSDHEPDEELERRRRKNLGALAQSYAPRGLADLLKLSAEGRARARARWRAQPRWERVGVFVVIALGYTCMGLIVLGAALEDGSLVLAGAAAVVVLMLGTAAVSAGAEMRRARRRLSQRQRREDEPASKVAAHDRPRGSDP
jgi:hypothetical protein